MQRNLLKVTRQFRFKTRPESKACALIPTPKDLHSDLGYLSYSASQALLFTQIKRQILIQKNWAEPKFYQAFLPAFLPSSSTSVSTKFPHSL